MAKLLKPIKTVVRVKITSNVKELKRKVTQAAKLIDEINNFKIVVTTKFL